MAPRLRYVYSPTLCSAPPFPSAFPVPPLPRAILSLKHTRNHQRWRQVPQRHHALRSLRHGTITAAPVAPQPLHAIPKSYILFILGLARSYLLRLLECTLSFYVNPFPHALKKFLVPNTFAPSLSTTRPPFCPTHSRCLLPHSLPRFAPRSLTYPFLTHPSAPLAPPPLAPRAPLAQYGDTRGEDPHALPVTVKIAEDAKYLVFVCDPEPDVR